MHMLQVMAILLSRGVGSSLPAEDWERALRCRDIIATEHEDVAHEAACLSVIFNKMVTTKVSRSLPANVMYNALSASA